MSVSQQQLKLVTSRPSVDYEYPYSVAQAYVYRLRKLMGAFPGEFALFCECFKEKKEETFECGFVEYGAKLQLFANNPGQSRIPYAQIRVHRFVQTVLMLYVQGTGLDTYIMDHPLPEQE